MDRQIIDIPAPIMRTTTQTWRIDWRSQSAGGSVSGQEQTVFSLLPRWVGDPAFSLHGDALMLFRARLTQARGWANAFRMRMSDPVAGASWAADPDADLDAYLSGIYVEHRPQITLVANADPGDGTILVDETTAERPVQIGQRISIADWPLEVTGRAVEVGGTRLTVAPFVRRAAEAGDMVDLIARGLFVLATDAPPLTYGLDRISTPTLNLIEWVTRA